MSIFPDVLVKDWLVNRYKYLFFYGSNKVLVLPPYDAEILFCCLVACRHLVFMDARWGF